MGLRFFLPPKNSKNAGAFSEFLCPPHLLGRIYSPARVAAGKRYERDTQAAGTLFSRKHSYLPLLTTPYPRLSEEIGVPGVLLPCQTRDTRREKLIFRAKVGTGKRDGSNDSAQADVPTVIFPLGADSVPTRDFLLSAVFQH